MSSQKVKGSSILIVDDHPVVREGIRNALLEKGYTAIFEASTRAEAVARLAHSNPSAVIVDINLPDGSGLDFIYRVRLVSKKIAIVILSFSDNKSHLLSAMQSGANAYIQKSAPLSEVVSALEHALKNPEVFIGSQVIQAMTSFNKGLLLTNREAQILSYLPMPLTNAEISSALLISLATLKTHLMAIYRKLGVKSRVAAIDKAKSLGLL